ncbi:MAG: hypothetical protein AAB308_09955, partial [Nitrospirota bacterium]
MTPSTPHPLEDAFADLFQILNQLPFPYCLMGALALGAWGNPRTTQDLDVMIAIGPTDRAQLLTALEPRGFAEDTQWAEHNPMIKEHHIRLHRGAVPVDLMLPKDDHDQVCLARRRQYELGKLSLWIISSEDLVIHKLKAGRAQDFIDVLSVLQRQAESLDRTYMTNWVKRLGIWEEWQYVQTQADSP